MTGKLVYSFAIALSTNLLTAFAGTMLMSIVVNLLGELSSKK